MRRRLVPLLVLGLFAACGFPGVSYENGSGDGGGNDASHPDGPVSAEGSGDDGSPADSTTGDGDDSAEAGDATGESSTGSDAAGDASDSSLASETGSDATSDAPGDSGDSSVVDAPSDVVEESPLESGADAPVDAPSDAHDAGVDAPPVCDFDMDTYKVEGVAACGTGNDCCDTDSDAHPGQQTYYAKADNCGSFDYNCNGSLDPEYPSSLKCGGNSITGCTGGSGFIGTDPGCGNSALYGTCVPNGTLSCQAGNEMTVTQGCR